MKLFLLALTLVLPAFAADTPALHGMAVFGKDRVYVSHLPMYHSPHDYQAIAEVNFGAGKAMYLKDAAAHPTETLYTVAPEEKFVLPQRFRNGQSFLATLYRGHFERGGIPVAQHVRVVIRKVLYFTRLNSSQAVPPMLATYLVVGAPGELFLIHRIETPPSFDQILTATGTAKTVSLVQTRFAPIRSGESIGGLTVGQSLYLEYDDLK